MKTYQDFLAVGESEDRRMDFIISAINEHKSSNEYITAIDAELYYKHQNPTIMRYQKFLYNHLGQAVPDVWKPNHKIASNWYEYFTTQSVQYLLGNGVMFGQETTDSKLGNDFSRKIQLLATYAKNGAVGFGFWNYDHLETFSITEFVPLYDEDDGGLKAGVRFWQIDETKPLRTTLYELDGYTEYIKRNDEDMTVLQDKRKYTQTISVSEVGNYEILDGNNYAGFPIIPMWNVNRQSDIVGNQNTIDAYDLMMSGLVNNVDEGEYIYWILQNFGAMQPIDDAKFIEQLKLTHVAHANGDDSSQISAHSVDVPFEATDKALEVLEKQLYKDFMALKVEDIASGSVTATQIQAAYEPLNLKTDRFEYCVTEFIMRLLDLLDIDDAPVYTRSQMSNQSELIGMLLSAAEYLDDEYITKKILALLGDSDRADEVLKRMDEESENRWQDENIVEEVV